MSEKLTFKQVSKQQGSAYIRGNHANPTVLIERSNGQIQTGELEMDTHNVNFIDPEDGLAKYHPNVPLEKLSDTYQEKLAIALAGAALRSENQIDEDDTIADEGPVSMNNPIIDENGMILPFEEWQANAAQSNSNVAVAGNQGEVAGSWRSELLKKVANLSEADQRALREYSACLVDKKMAQRAGNGEGSTLHGRRAGDALKRMSEEARSIAGKYASMDD